MRAALKAKRVQKAPSSALKISAAMIPKCIAAVCIKSLPFARPCRSELRHQLLAMVSLQRMLDLHLHLQCSHLSVTWSAAGGQVLCTPVIPRSLQALRVLDAEWLDMARDLDDSSFEHMSGAMADELKLALVAGENAAAACLPHRAASPSSLKVAAEARAGCEPPDCSNCFIINGAVPRAAVIHTS